VALVLDTGPLVSLLDRDDDDHVRCRQLILGSTEARVIPAPVLSEVDYFAYTRGRAVAMIGLLDDILDGSYRVEDLLPADYRRVRDLCERYADSDLGFVDASVLAIVERLNEPKLATLDHRHFRMLRPRHVDALTLLPE
jgi:predicted nucleic acid-binding protein